MNNLSVLWSNPHLRYAVIAMAVLEIAAVWLPQYKDQISATQKIVSFYALAAAANSSGTPPTTGNDIAKSQGSTQGNTFKQP